MVGLTINGSAHNVDVEPDTPLLWAIREQVGLTGTKYGCGIAQCGACTVHIDGVAVRSCVTPIATVESKQKIVTLEGLAKGTKLHPLQQAFIEEQAVQCGYCINGMVMQAADLLAKNKKPTDADIKNALANNLCRCGTHVRIVRAVKRAAAA